MDAPWVGGCAVRCSKAQPIHRAAISSAMVRVVRLETLSNPQSAPPGEAEYYSGIEEMAGWYKSRSSSFPLSLLSSTSFSRSSLLFGSSRDLFHKTSIHSFCLSGSCKQATSLLVTFQLYLHSLVRATVSAAILRNRFSLLSNKHLPFIRRRAASFRDLDPT